MNKEGRVVHIGTSGVTVEVAGNSNSDQPLAPCCTVPTVIVEAKNPLGITLHSGERVEMSDGLGTIALGAFAFIAFPAFLYGVGTILFFLWWVGVLGILGGLALAILFFRSLKVGQFPRVVRRIGSAVEENNDKEFL